MVVNEQQPSYGTLTVMVHLAIWHAIHFHICGVLYTQLTGTSFETWQCEARCRGLATDTSHQLLYRNTTPGATVEAEYMEV